MRKTVEELKELAKTLRKTAVTMIYDAKAGHPGGSLSAADIVAALYFGEILFHGFSVFSCGESHVKI